MNGIEIVNRAKYVSNLQSNIEPDFEKSGIFWLNRVIGLKSIQKMLNPYYKTISFQTEPQKYQYFIRDLIEPVTLRYFLQNVPYTLLRIGRNQYFGGAIFKNIQSLPTTWHPEKVPNGYNIYLYLPPAYELTFELMGKFNIPSVIDEEFELDEILDDWYQTFLIFELAEILCLNNKITMPPSANQYLIKLRREIACNNLPDTTQISLSVFNGRSSTNNIFSSIAQYELGSNGWIP